MPRFIKVLNLSRTPLALGNKQVSPARNNPAPTTVDMDDGKVRRDPQRFNDRFVVVGGLTGSESTAAIADVPTAGAATAADNATAINAILAALRTNGIISPS